MKSLVSSRAFLGALIVVALVAGVAIGGAFFARSVSDKGDGTAAADEAIASSSTSSTAASIDGGTPGGEANGLNGSQTDTPDAALDPAELRAVEPVGGPPPLAYRDDQSGIENTGTIPPATLPAEVSLSATENLHPGDPISIRVVPKEGSELYGFRARLCKKGATIEGLYDFIPEVAPNCISKPLSSSSDAFVEVKGEPPYQLSQGTFRVGLGTDVYTLDDGSQGEVACTKADPCQLVLQVHVPYGFGYFTYDLSFA